MYGQAAAGFILKQAGGEMYNHDFTPYQHVTKGGIFCSTAIAKNLNCLSAEFKKR